jgi:hypothetical protein
VTVPPACCTAFSGPLADDERGPAEVTEWARIVQLLAESGGAYDPDTDAFVQDELAADAERERAQQLEDEQRRQEEEAEAARRAALAPDVLRHALLRTHARTGLLDSLSEGEQAAVNRLPDSDPAAALAVNGLLAAPTKPELARARGPRRDGRPGHGRRLSGETLHQRQFLHATLLDTSKREERPPCCPGNEPRSAGQVNGGC